jgi:hypothetical protein
MVTATRAGLDDASLSQSQDEKQGRKQRKGGSNRETEHDMTDGTNCATYSRTTSLVGKPIRF